jgi:hypothetical protein
MIRVQVHSQDDYQIFFKNDRVLVSYQRTKFLLYSTVQFAMTGSGSVCGYRMMGITKQKFGNEHDMSINEFSHDSLFPGLFVAFTYNKKQPPPFGAAPTVWCIILSLHGLLFRPIPNNLSNYNVLTANAPFLSNLRDIV